MTGSNPISIITESSAPRRSSLRVVMIVTAVLLALLVVAAVFAVREFREHQRLQAADDDRSNAMNTAQQFALRMDTFKGDRLDDYESSVNAMLTTRAKGEFKQSFPAFEKVYQQGKAVGTGELHAAGIEDIDQDSATVLGDPRPATVKSSFGDPEAVPALVRAAGQGRRRLEDRQVRGRFVMASVTWYDLLGVERDATPEQVRVGLARGHRPRGAGHQPVQEVQRGGRGAARRAGAVGVRRRLAASEPAVEAEPDNREPGTAPTASAATTTEPMPGVPRWRGLLASPGVTVAVALVTVLVIAVGGYFWFQNNRHDEQVDAGQEASAAAERALPFVLSYDYRQLPGRQVTGGALPESPVPEGVHRHLRQADRLDRRAAGSGQADLGRGQGHRAQRRGRRLRVRRGEGDRVHRPGDHKDGGTPKFSLNRLTVSMVSPATAGWWTTSTATDE